MSLSLPEIVVDFPYTSSDCDAPAVSVAPAAAAGAARNAAATAARTTPRTDASRGTRDNLANAADAGRRWRVREPTLECMARTYTLDHFAKGTGANVAPVDEDATPSDESKLNTVPVRSEPRRSARRARTGATSLPPGHVRKKATGELGRVQSVDPKAGTASVLWLRSGAVSTVPLTAISRR